MEEITRADDDIAGGGAAIKDDLHFVLASMGLSPHHARHHARACDEDCVGVVQQQHWPPNREEQQQQRRNLPSPSEPVLDARHRTMANMQAALIFLGTLLVPILVKLILTYAESSGMDSATAMLPPCSSYAEGFLNLSSILASFNLTSPPAKLPPDEQHWPRKVLASAVMLMRSPPKNARPAAPVVHATYMADAYRHNHKHTCKFYCCRGEAASATLFLPPWLQHQEHQQLSAVATSLLLSPQQQQPMAKFLSSMQGKVPEDWHLKAFQEAMASSCSSTAKQQAILLQKHSPWLARVDDALVPSMLCSAFLLQEEHPSSTPQHATLGRLLR